MTNPAQHQIPASKKQLAYLRTLAAERGRSFAYPHTSAEAGREIGRLKGEATLSQRDRRREDKIVREAMAERGDAARVRDEELSGYAATAGWSREVDDEAQRLIRLDGAGSPPRLSRGSAAPGGRRIARPRGVGLEKGLTDE